ncbi:MAG: tyrosine/phenylalanine carboxypeptidase domain-containing protein [Parcubacteria group bacterium]
MDISRRGQDLLQLKRDILEQETNETIKQIYRWKINEKIAELRMLGETKSGNDRRFFRYSKFIYGKPEQEIFAYTISQIKKVIDGKINDTREGVREAAKRLSNELSDPLSIEKPKITDLKDFIKESSESKEFTNTEYNAEEIKYAFEQALEKYKLTGWNVVVTEKGTAVSVSQENKNVNIPSSRKMKENKLRALIEHEIGTHVLRREKGEKTKLKLLGLGLDRYLKGEEGIATYEEQKILGANEFAGFDGHLAIALAMGMDGKKRDFRKVYEILKDYYFINSKKEESEAIIQAENSAWNRCVRTFRGTSCGSCGACLTRDIVYREGNIGTWNVVKNKPEEVKRFMVGKYDPGNQRHIWILEQLGITDSDLDDLEKELS